MSFFSWFTRGKRLPIRRRTVSQTHRFRPILEQLEEREVPSAFFVSTLGNDANNGTSAGTAFRTIQAAITAAAASADGNDTINVAAGTYATSGVDTAITIPSDAELTNLQILGGWNSTFTVRNPASTATVYIPQNTGSIIGFDVTIADPSTSIDGFTFVFDGTLGTGGTRQSAGMLVQATGVTINNNILETGSSSTATANDAYAIQTLFNGDISNLTVSNNTITASAANASGGIYLNPGTNTGTITVSGNTVNGTNLLQGIVVDTISGVTVTGNTLSRTGPADVDFRQLIFVGPFNGTSNQTNVTVTRNTVDNNGAGVGVTIDDSVGIEIGNTSGNGRILTNVTVSENFVTDSEVGILVSPGVDADTTTIRGNSITGNTTGLARLFDSAEVIDASGNWWGSATGPTVTTNPGGIGNSIGTQTGTAQVDYSPWLTVGTDTSAGTPGFQGDLSQLTANATSPVSNLQGGTGNLQETINRINTGGTLVALAGTYNESVAINKTLTLSPNGSAVGTITLTGIGGGSTLNGSTFAVDLSSAPLSDLLQNSNSALTLTGATLLVSATSTSSAGQVFTIVSSPGGISGTFNGLANGSVFLAANGRTYRINYTATSVTLTDAALAAAPIITANPGSRTITAGGSATFTAAATTSTGTLTVQWQVSTDGGASWGNLTNGDFYSGVNTTALTVSGATTFFNGYQFRAVFTDSQGLSSTTAAASLTVNSFYAYHAYVYSYHTYVYAYNAYVSGGGENARLSYIYAAAAFQYSAYAYHYSSIGNNALAATYSYYAAYYGYFATYYAYRSYQLTGNAHAYRATLFGSYSWAYSYYTALGY